MTDKFRISVLSATVIHLTNECETLRKDLRFWKVSALFLLAVSTLSVAERFIK